MRSIIQRLNALLNANTHYLIDQAEDPEVMLAQLMRDVDTGIRQARAAVVQAVASEKRIRAELDSLRGHAAAWEQRAERALTGGDEAGARAALERQVHDAAAVAELEPAWRDASDAAERLQRQLAALRERREGYLRRRTRLLVRQRVARAGRKVALASVADTDIASVADQFDALERKVADTEAFTAAEISVREREREQDGETLAESLDTAQAVDTALVRLREKIAAKPAA